MKSNRSVRRIGPPAGGGVRGTAPAAAGGLRGPAGPPAEGARDGPHPRGSQEPGGPSASGLDGRFETGSGGGGVRNPARSPRPTTLWAHRRHIEMRRQNDGSGAAGFVTLQYPFVTLPTSSRDPFSRPPPRAVGDRVRKRGSDLIRNGHRVAPLWRLTGAALKCECKPKETPGLVFFDPCFCVSFFDRWISVEPHTGTIPQEAGSPRPGGDAEGGRGVEGHPLRGHRRPGAPEEPLPGSLIKEPIVFTPKENSPLRLSFNRKRSHRCIGWISRQQKHW